MGTPGLCQREFRDSQVNSAASSECGGTEQQALKSDVALPDAFVSGLYFNKYSRSGSECELIF